MQRQTDVLKEHKAHEKVGCCAFWRAFLRLFKSKKRRHSYRRQLSRECRQQPLMEETEQDTLPSPTMEEAAVDECLECDTTKAVEEAPEMLLKHLKECVEPEQDQDEPVQTKQDLEESAEGEILEEPVEAKHGLEEPVEAEKVPEECTEVLEELVEEQQGLEETVKAEKKLEEPVPHSVQTTSEDSLQPCPVKKSRRKKGKSAKDSMTMATGPRSASPELMLRPRGALLTFRSDVVHPPATLLMGTDKEENDHLLAQATESVVFFHVDNLPSAHVYLQLEPGQGLRDVPRPLVHDAAQLCKANSAQGNKLANVVVLYTPGSNLRKTRHMKAGEVGFADTREVLRILVPQRDEKVMERLNSTKTKVLSAKAEREKQQRARQRQMQKAEAKQRKRKQRQELQEDRQDKTEPPEDAWVTEPVQPVATQANGKQRRRRRKRVQEDESEEENGEQEMRQQQTLLQGKNTCSFPVGAEQRRLLQTCRATVERKFDVQVMPPRKGEGRGTVTGAPDDVADALQELKRLLYPARQKDTTGTKGGKGGSKGGKAKAESKEKSSSRPKRKQ